MGGANVETGPAHQMDGGTQHNAHHELREYYSEYLTKHQTG